MNQETPSLIRTLTQRITLGTLSGVLCGAASALFLTLLDLVTATRTANTSLVYALPFAGALLGLALERWGRPVAGGHSLVIDTFHEDRPPLPLRLTPMVLFGTLWTHLFGGSAGREGTAVQMGAGLTDALSQAFRVTPEMRRSLLVAGIAGGFGSVFGTPFAGAIFALEVLTFGRLEWRSLAPALIAAFVGDRVTRGLGIAHTPYPTTNALPISLATTGKWLLVAVAVALVVIVFIESTHGMKRMLEKRVRSMPLRLAIGGALVVALYLLSGTDRYLGLGVPTIVASFSDLSLPQDAFAWKLLFTVVTVGAGFLGGEVTPLFFVGAALGNLLGRQLGLPIDLAAGVAMAATFGAAANTPIALTIMAVELCGSAALVPAAIVCVTACLFTGHRGLYPAQRLVRTKLGRRLESPITLRDPPPSR